MRRRLSRATGFGRQLPPPEGLAVRASSQIEDAVYGRYADCSPGPRQGGVPRGCDHSLRLVRSTPCCVPLTQSMLLGPQRTIWARAEGEWAAGRRAAAVVFAGRAAEPDELWRQHADTVQVRTRTRLSWCQAQECGHRRSQDRGTRQGRKCCTARHEWLGRLSALIRFVPAV